MFIFDRERDRAWAEKGQRERETQNLKQAPGSELSAQSPMWSLNPRAVKSWPELKLDAQLTKSPRRPSIWYFNSVYKTLDISENPQNCIIQRLKPNINNGLYLIIMYQYWLINCNTCTTLIQNVRENCVFWRRTSMGTLCFLLNFSINLKLL